MRVTQRRLVKYMRLHNEVKRLQEELDRRKEDLSHDLSMGATVEMGSRTAKLNKLLRKNVSWKSVVVRLKSLGYVNKVLAATKPTPTYRLVVR